MTSFFNTIDKQTTPDPFHLYSIISINVIGAFLLCSNIYEDAFTAHTYYAPFIITGRHRLKALESTEDHGSSPTLIPVMVHGSSCRTRRAYVYCLVGTLSAVEDDLRTLTILLIPTTPSLYLLSSLTQAELSTKIVKFLIVYFASAFLHIYNLNRYSI